MRNILYLNELYSKVHRDIGEIIPHNEPGYCASFLWDAPKIALIRHQFGVFGDKNCQQSEVCSRSAGLLGGE